MRPASGALVLPAGRASAAALPRSQPATAQPLAVAPQPSGGALQQQAASAQPQAQDAGTQQQAEWSIYRDVGSVLDCACFGAVCSISNAGT